MPSDVERFASERLAAQLRQQIETGALAPGERLPPYRQLAAEHSVAVNTAQAAVRRLEAAGLVEIKPGSGATVRHPEERVSLAAELLGLRERLSKTRTELADTEAAVSGLLARLADDLESRSPEREND